ncbi:hypothetical protein DXG01_000246 [Tephrocybe rancida]|nr:hypothetical protein DXG01_000246 [Tephrocybe rancida]
MCKFSTWQDGISGERSSYTNVLRLTRTINHEDKRPHPLPAIPQIVFYQSGIGSDKNLYSRYVEGTMGGSLGDKVEEAYAFIAHNYRQGDEIFLFGFSRVREHVDLSWDYINIRKQGAYTARMVATFIGEIGVLNRTDMDHFSTIFLAYQKLGKTEDPEEAETLRQKLKPWTEDTSPGKVRAASQQSIFTVKCLGVFDTVGSFGLPEELVSRSAEVRTMFGFPDKVLGTHIEHTYQALALNELRADFNCAKFERTPEGRQRGQVLKQIGGGYDDHDLSDLTLTWMAAQIESILSLDTPYLKSIFHPVSPWGMQKFHDSRAGIFSLSHSIRRPIPARLDERTCETIHASVKEQDLSKFPELEDPARFLTHKDSRNGGGSSHYDHHGLKLPQPETQLDPSLDITDARKQLVFDGLPIRSNILGKPSGLHLPPLNNARRQRRYPPSHPRPIPSTVVFSRDAPPLHLPKLDTFLSSLLPPVFPGASSEMFPPMARLAETGMSLDDLETNQTVAPFWRNRKTLLSSTVNIVLGFTGSSALASFYSLQGLLNTVQVFALILSTIVPVGGQDLGNKWRNLFLGTIPNILALNFASTLVEALIFLLIFMSIAAGLLYIFYRSSYQCDRYGTVEGFQPTVPKGAQRGLVLVTFLLTVIYLPLSTMSIHVLVWSQDLWVVPNPYTNATSYPPLVPPLGPASEYRDALDFCWTTTMQRNQVNYAPVVIVLAAIVFIFLTVWFPLALHRVIKVSLPKVDRFTELGRLRNDSELDAEYHRLLSRFRRSWGTYESTYLGAKFSTLLIVAVIDPDNCLFRSVSRSRLPVCIIAPFLDPVNNASEWTSRLNYLTTSIVALVVALNIPSGNIFNTYILYTIYIITYSLSFYFTIINLGPIQRLLKRFTRRIDFSIDIFSPRLDVSSSSPHTRRRIWQESITTLLLTTPDCAIPQGQTMTYAQAKDSEFPPYLLNFGGTPGERHVENLKVTRLLESLNPLLTEVFARDKILREIGSFSYKKAAALTSGIDRNWHRHLEQEIQHNFIGPDCYWKDPLSPGIPDCKNYFGNAWWIPFPPTLVTEIVPLCTPTTKTSTKKVLRYDDGPLAVLADFTTLETYISQNSSPAIRRRRLVRLSLRAIEGRVVSWPYEHLSPIGTSTGWFGKAQYKARKSIDYRFCILNIKHRGHLLWNGLQLGSGFDVELQYTKKFSVPGEAIGLNDDYDLTAPLARFLNLNHDLISERMPHIEEVIDDYRRNNRKVDRWKNRVLSYRFLSDVYDHPHDPATLTRHALEFENDPRVQRLVNNCQVQLTPAYRRWLFVSQSETRTWWYLFWDDLWRRNHVTTPGLKRYASDFNPYYPTSIAYTPLPRAVLETFLSQRSLFSKTGSWTTLFTPGFLNKIYLRLNDTVFRSSSKEIKFHVGQGSTERDMMEVDLETRVGQASSIGTGAGTNHDDSWIQTRPQYRWEGILNDAPYAGKRRRKWLSKLSAWMGLTPTWRSGMPSDGLSLDVKLENGRFVLLRSNTLTAVKAEEEDI